jgi:two-component system chemotaxis sensor kinase CheA
MPSFEQLKQTFFDECSEAVQQIEAGLTDLVEGSSSNDTINAVFRSVHSVKGGAGIFGFQELVDFAHVFETVLDAMRSWKLPVTRAVVDALLPASDVLSDLITMSRSREAIPADFGCDCRAALEQLMKSESESGSPDDDGSPAPAEFEGLEFTPVRADQFDAPDGADGTRTYRILFRPKPEMLKKANEPLFILRELRKLGELDLKADTDRLPPFGEIEPDVPYISWSGTLRTDAARARIEEVFEFVADDCEIDISEIGQDLVADNEIGSVDAAVSPETGRCDSSPAPINFAAETATRASAQGHDSKSESVVRPTAAKSAATTTRVELEKIDRVVNLVGELVIAQAMLGQIVQNLPEEIGSRLAQILDEVSHHTRELKDSVMSMRAQPLGAVFQRMPRLVRELATKTGKRVRLEMAGENTEVDRSIIERLGDPLTHIIRNSIDHGIETPPDRVAAGKSEEGTIRLSAEHRGGRIVIEVSDDGAGINQERVLRKAREKGLVRPDASLSEDEINNLIFMPGFSTAEEVSDISGRGVGMDVVRRNIQDVGGRISLTSQRGVGMAIQLALPLTLAVMDGMVIRVGQETYVIPMSAIVECLRPPRSDIHRLIGTCGMLKLRGNLVPLVHLGDLLEVASTASESDERVIIITDAGEGFRFGIVVDELCGHQQVVIKSIEESYGPVSGIAGATILGNGRVAFILDVEKLSDLASRHEASINETRLANSRAAVPLVLN